MKDQVVLVDEHNFEQGVMDKLDAHRHPAKLHRAVSVWLFDDHGSTLLQRRSKEKIVGAGWWGNAVCGNVRPGETNLECAIRRLRQELNIVNVELSSQFDFTYSAYCNEEYGERELDEVFIGRYSGEAQPNLSEASEAAWAPFDELLAQAAAISYPKPEDTLQRESSELEESTHPALMTVGGSSFLLAPWTVFMLRDPRLQQQFA